MSERVTWDLTPAEQIDFARRQIEGNVSLIDTLWIVPRESRDKFKEMWKIASLPRTFGEAFAQGRSKFVSNAGEMLKGVGEFTLVVGPRYVGTKLKNIPGAILPGEGRDRAREALWGMESRLFKQLLKELASDKSEKILRLEEQLRAETDPHQIEILRYALGEAHENWRPVMSFIGDEFFYFRNKQELMNRIANNPAEVTADIIAIAKFLRGGGRAAGLAFGLKGLRTGARLQKALKVLKIARHGVEVVGDPPSALGKGKKVIDLGVRPKKRLGGEKRGTTTEELPANTAKKELEQVGKQAKKIGEGKGKSAALKSEELEEAIPDDDTDDEEKRGVKGTDGDDRNVRKFKPGPSPRFRVE